MIKVAIFGGSFDPPHKGHQYIVERALELLDIDRLIVIPAFLNPFKKSTLASASQRLAWSHTIFDPVEGVEVDESEVAAGKSVYTSETIMHLSKKYDIAYIIVGSDNLNSITRWHSFAWIDERVTWVIASRKGHPVDRSSLRDSIVLEVDIPISSTDIRRSGDLARVDIRIQNEVKKLLQ